MSKTTVTYLNIFNSNEFGKRRVMKGSDNMFEQFILTIDEKTSDYTRMTRFKKG